MVRCSLGVLLFSLSLIGYGEGVRSESLRLCYSQLTGQTESLASTRNNDLFNRFYLQLRNGAESVGLKLTAQPLPWKRCAHLIATGDMDATVPVIWSPERETWAVYPKTDTGQLDTSVRLRRAEYYIYVPLNSRLAWDGESLAGNRKALWAPVGYKVYDKLREHRALTLERYGMDEAFSMVGLNRLDGAVTESSDADFYINNLKLADKIKRLPTPFYTDDWYLVFSYDFFERSPEAARIIWQAGSKLSSQNKHAEVATD